MNEFAELIKAANETRELAKKLGRLNVYSVYISLIASPESAAIHLDAEIFDELKAKFSWKTTIVPTEFGDDRESTVLDGVEIFAIQDREEEV
jgi:hypothetical protein